MLVKTERLKPCHCIELTTHFEKKGYLGFYIEPLDSLDEIKEGSIYKPIEGREP
jgi:hypothetical protein